MYRIIPIGGKDYKLEYSIEASLYSDATKKLMDLMFAFEEAQTDEDAKRIIDGLADLPRTSLTMFYAGLLEHHGPDADGSVSTLRDAKILVSQYFAENEGTNFNTLMSMCAEQMGDDGFFNLIGLTDSQTQEQKPVKIPQDHQKKQTKRKTSEN